MKIKKILYITVCLLTLQLFFIQPMKAQSIHVLKLGISQVNNLQWGEALYGIGLTNLDNLKLLGPALGVAGGIEFHNQEVSPKISLGANWGLVFTTSLNLNYYPQRGQRFVFTPEIGLNAVKILHITYGYQFNQVSPEESNTNQSRHRISLFLTLPLTLFGNANFGCKIPPPIKSH